MHHKTTPQVTNNVNQSNESVLYKTVQNVYKYKTIEPQDVLEYNLLHWRIQGGARDARPQLRSKFSLFMQFSAKILPNNRFLSTSQGLAPPPRFGKSWIRLCIASKNLIQTKMITNKLHTFFSAMIVSNEKDR